MLLPMQGSPATNCPLVYRLPLRPSSSPEPLGWEDLVVVDQVEVDQVEMDQVEMDQVVWHRARSVCPTSPRCPLRCL